MERLGVSHVLNGLRLKDSKGFEIPDIVARRQALDDLIENGLSPYEVRYVRDKLNARPFHKDIFPALPQELQLQVATLLSFDDVLAVFDVSQAWRKMLLTETFVLMVMRVHFASRWYRYSTNQLQQDAVQLSQWLTKAIATCQKVKAGNVLSRQYYFTLPGQSECLRMSDYPTDTEFRRSDPIYSEGSFQYKNSRIAFIHDDGRMIVVKALQKKDDFSLIFMTDDREKFKQWHLSDQIILATTRNPRKLVVWSFQEKKYERFTSPNSIRHMSARNNSFAILTDSHELFCGKINDGIKAVQAFPASPPRPDFKSFAILLHPHNERILFTFYIATTEPWVDPLMIIQEFNYEQKTSFQYEFLWELHTFPPEKKFGIRLTLLPVGIVEIGANRSWGLWEYCGTNPYVQFDIYSKKFLYCWPDTNHDCLKFPYTLGCEDKFRVMQLDEEGYRVWALDDTVELTDDGCKENDAGEDGG